VYFRKLAGGARFGLYASDVAVIALVVLAGGCRQERPVALAPAPVDELSPALAQARAQAESGKQKAALASWKLVLVLAAGPQLAPDKKEAARREALTAIARSPYWIGRPEEAWTVFQRLGGSQAEWMMEQAADACRDVENLACAADAARLLIRVEPHSSRLCLWRAHTLRAATLSDGHAMLAEAKLMGEAFDWKVKENNGTASEQLACKMAFESLTGEAALRVHRKAQEWREVRLYQLAVELYEVYLSRLWQSPQSYEPHFFYAEALWASERWPEAIAEYDLVVRMDPHGKYHKEASKPALMSFASCHDWGLEEPTAPLHELRVSRCQKEDLERLDKYLSTNQPSPGDDTYVKVLYRKARTYFDAYYLEGAVPLLQRIVVEFPTSEMAIYAGELHVQALKLLGQYRETIETAESYLNGLLKSDPEIADEVRLLRDGAKLAQAITNGATGKDLTKLRQAVRNDEAAIKDRQQQDRRKVPDLVPASAPDRPAPVELRPRSLMPSL
jgi:tetratricopeptide (TPR) repeat protein